MNKRTRCLVSIYLVALMVFLNACNLPDNWKTIDIEGYGEIKVPKQWEVSLDNGFIYIFSAEGGDSTNILAQYRTDKNINSQLDKGLERTWLQDENFSNGTCITKYKVYCQDGTVTEMFTLSFTSLNTSESTEFFCLDSSVSEDILKSIAKSYVVAGE